MKRNNGSRGFYIGVFLVSGILMALQIVQSRIFSVTTWYHISFLVVSVAMFGLTLGAIKVYKGKETDQRAHYGRDMAEACFRFAVGMIVGLVGQLSIPVMSEDLLLTLVALPIVTAMTLPAYYYAGVVLSLAITRAPFPAARTYGFDLIGAAAGCLFALGLMETVDGPSGIMVLSLMALGAMTMFDKGERQFPQVMAILLCFGIALNVAGPKPLIGPYWVKKYHFPESELAYDHWNSISRVIVQAESKQAPPYLWGPSRLLPKSLKTSWYELLIDGDASTPINHWTGDLKALDYLNYDVTTVAYAMPGLKSTAVIGLGGGRDVLSSLHAGAKSVTALDVNNVQVSLLSKVEPFKSYANIGTHPGVRLIHSEARSWFAHNPDKFDLIQMSLVDTWASTGAGAFALTENGLYTVEAWKTFLDHLNPGGALTVSRWYMADAQAEGERLVSLTVGALLDAGIKDPKQHIFIATGYRIVTLVMSRDPFTSAQLDAMEKRVKEMDYGILISPRKSVAGTEFAKILDAKSRGDLENLAKASEYDISPPTDWRPFFFNQVRLGSPALVWKLMCGGAKSAMTGHAHAIANLYVIMSFSLVMVIFAIVYPLRSELKARNDFIKAGTAWFILIGLGFMLLEISLMQRMSVYLGHPAYGLAIVLFSLVLATGIGSLLCDRFPLNTTSSRVCWAVATAAAIGTSVFFIDGAMRAFSDAPLFIRAVLCLCVTAPVGCLMGYGFPTGMEMAKQAHARSTAWFWGINGAAGVMGSSLAISINIGAGIDVAMFISALCYAFLALTAIGYKAK